MNNSRTSAYSKLLGVISRGSFRKLLFLLILILLALLFALSYIKPGGTKYHIQGKLERCLNDKLKEFYFKIKSYSAFVYLTDFVETDEAPSQKYFLPYIGNGYIGISTDGLHGVWLKGNRGLDIPTDFNPLVKFEIKDYSSQGAVVLDIQDGQITNFTCFQQTDSKTSNCIAMTQTLYIHRTRPGVLIQDMAIYNPTDKNIEVGVIQESLTSWSTEHSVIRDVPADKDTGSEHSEWYIGSKVLDNQVLLTVAGRQLSPSGILELPSRSKVTKRCLTLFDYHILEKNADKQFVADRKRHNLKTLKSLLSISKDILDDEHVTAWKSLWSSGFSISESKAPEALNADVINSTLYYIVSHVPSILQDVTSTSSEKRMAQQLLNNPDTCYHNRHRTLQFSELWHIGDKVSSMNEGVDNHLNSLEKYGCSNYIKAGAEGVLQAVLLSLGGLSFVTVKDAVLHLEFNVDPADLHRDYQFRNIKFANMTWLNISVIVNESNYAVIHISSSSRTVYASDAGLSEPVSLSEQSVAMPVKLTKPLTSILYVYADKNHLVDMRKVVHHVEIPALAPAQDHRVIALHRHGHSYGGLPAIFWILLVSLIAAFHFFLFKMIFNEFCRSEYSPSNMRRRADS